MFGDEVSSTTPYCPADCVSVVSVVDADADSLLFLQPKAISKLANNKVVIDFFII